MSHWNWTTRIRCDDSKVGGSFSILIFIGEVPESDPKEWRKSPTFVGSENIFASKRSEANYNVEVEGFVHLNHALAKHSASRSLDPKDVVPFLEHNLHWRVKKVCILWLSSGKKSDSFPKTRAQALRSFLRLKWS